MAYHTPPEMEDTDSLARGSRSYRLSLWSTQVSIFNFFYRSKERSESASLSHSLSENSDFEDAVSEQEELGMVNLHMQVTR